MSESEGVEIDMRSKGPNLDPSAHSSHVPAPIVPPGTPPENLPPTPPPAPVHPVVDKPRKLSKDQQIANAMAELDSLEKPSPTEIQKVVDQNLKPKSTSEKLEEAKKKTAPHLFKAGDARTRELARKGGRAGKVPKFREILGDKLHEHADEFVRPYVEAMKLREDPNWKPSAKARFFLLQTEIAEKAFDRFEGKPIQRNRNVDKEDNDLTPEVLNGIGKDAGIEILVNIFNGVESGIAFDIEGEAVEDAN